LDWSSILARAYKTNVLLVSKFKDFVRLQDLMAVTMRNAVSWGMKCIDVSNESILPPAEDVIVSDKYAVSNVKTLVNSYHAAWHNIPRHCYQRGRIQCLK